MMVMVRDLDTVLTSSLSSFPKTVEYFQISSPSLALRIVVRNRWRRWEDKVVVRERATIDN